MKQKISMNGIAEIRITETGARATFTTDAKIEGVKTKVNAEVTRDRDGELLLMFPVPAGEYAQGYSIISLPVTDKEARKSLGVMLEFAEGINELIDQVAVRVLANAEEGKGIEREKFIYALKKALKDNWENIADATARAVLARHLGMKEIISLSPVVGMFTSSQFIEGFKKIEGKEADRLAELLVKTRDSFINSMKRYKEILHTPIEDIHAINYYDPAHLLAQRGYSTLLRCKRKNDISLQKHSLADEVYSKVVDTMRNTIVKEMALSVGHKGVHGWIEVYAAYDKRTHRAELHSIETVTGSIEDVLKKVTLGELCNRIENILTDRFRRLSGRGSGDPGDPGRRDDDPGDPGGPESVPLLLPLKEEEEEHERKQKSCRIGRITPIPMISEEEENEDDLPYQPL